MMPFQGIAYIATNTLSGYGLFCVTSIVIFDFMITVMVFGFD